MPVCISNRKSTLENGLPSVAALVMVLTMLTGLQPMRSARLIDRTDVVTKVLGAGGEGSIGVVVLGTDPQMVKPPPSVTEPSVYHLSVCPAVMATLLGPTEPEYWVSPISM